MYERILWGILIFQAVLFLVTMVLLFTYGTLFDIKKFRGKVEGKKEAFENAAAYAFGMFLLLCFVLMGVLLAASGQAS